MGEKTLKNLGMAFAGESQANRKYLAFAKQAEKEGFDNAAKLFRAAAEAETIHAHGHLRLMNGVSSTKENLTAAIAGETFEFETMYPQMVKDAKEENVSAAEKYFGLAMEAEAIHAALYKKALESLEVKNDVTYLICGVCGFIAENKAPENCPICKAKPSAFYSVN